MNNVKRIGTANNLKNIPHMLRNLAEDFESGAEQMPMTLLVIAVNSQDYPPEVYQFGDELGRMTEVGALTSVIHTMMQLDTLP